MAQTALVKVTLADLASFSAATFDPANDILCVWVYNHGEVGATSVGDKYWYIPNTKVPRPLDPVGTPAHAALIDGVNILNLGTGATGRWYKDTPMYDDDPDALDYFPLYVGQMFLSRIENSDPFYYFSIRFATTVNPSVPSGAWWAGT